jgi:hypothetical protein
MNLEELKKNLAQEFNISSLEEDDKDDMLDEIAKTIMKQFLDDIYPILGEKNFDALQASASMGVEFYGTTLKHLLPNYQEVFALSKKKVLDAFNATA